jgi:hypothetical protein
MALGSTQSVTEMSTRNLKKKRIIKRPGGKVRPARRLTTLPPSVGSLNLSQPYGLPWPVTVIAFTFFLRTSSSH